MASPGYTKLFDVATQLKRSQPCVLGYIKSGKLAAEKGADGHWYISDTSLAKFIYQRDLALGAKALTEVDDMVDRVVALEAKVEKLTAGMKVMLAHMKGTPPADE
jgi:hypothetical protein